MNRYRGPLNDDGFCIGINGGGPPLPIRTDRTHPLPTARPRWRLRSSAPKPRCPPTPAKAPAPAVKAYCLNKFPDHLFTQSTFIIICNHTPLG